MGNFWIPNIGLVIKYGCIFHLGRFWGNSRGVLGDFNGSISLVRDGFEILKTSVKTLIVLW